MKAISLLPATTIRNHQTNTSPSKIAHQFSKGKRFPEPNPQCKVAFYSYDSQLSERKTTMGYGTKVDFTKDLTDSPASTKYNHKSAFEESKNKGKSFGLERQKSPDRSYLIPQLSRVPGPGQYENQVNTRMTQSFTMRPQTIDWNDRRQSFKFSPGPTAYQSIDLEPSDGRFTVSKFGDAKLCKINPNTPRFKSVKQSPGPLSYLEGDNLASDGKYRLSHRKGDGTRAFALTARTGFTDDIKRRQKVLPGPGFYEPPTDFGVYGNSKYYKTLGNFKSTIE